ncbi:T9SS type A sorting domain-containing protein [uncultured Duncaniella sp.]|uniref:T9SS type A sorting domain-containing protein n=1 Tax=uncultured Duncaniella sp. TaxID=2768039 RepID=UPI00261F9554|nr:T9SS type A sorting domain-containing protein [uncultured Duncaniella sp.]
MSKRLSLFLIYLLSMALWPGLCFGQESTEQLLKLHNTDGKIICFQLKDEPVTTFSDGMLVVRAGDFSASYPLENLVKYTFATEYSSIQSVDAAQRINIGFINNIVSVIGLEAGAKVCVYGVDGSLIDSVIATDEVTVMDLNGFQSGVYIVKAENARLKILKR